MNTHKNLHRLSAAIGTDEPGGARKGQLGLGAAAKAGEERRPGALEEQLRGVMRKRQYSRKTEESYVGWYRRYVKWHGLRHPREMGVPEVEAFLTHLAINRGVVAATQNQVLNALVFLYRDVLEMEVKGIEQQRARHSRRLPNVLSREETAALLAKVAGDWCAGCSTVAACA